MKKTFEILEIATANPAGFTIDKNTLKPVTSGYCVAVAETQDSFNLAGLDKVVATADNRPDVQAIGGWFNPENEMFYFDAVRIFDTEAEAKAAGIAEDQIAIFHLDTLETITLK